MRLSDNSGGDNDTLGPLPSGPGWSSSDDQMSLPPYDHPTIPPPQYPGTQCLIPSPSIASFLFPVGSHGSSGSSSASGNTHPTMIQYGSPDTHRRSPGRSHDSSGGRIRHSSSLSSASEFTSVSQQQPPPHYHTHQPSADRRSLRSLGHMPQDASGSRASFQQALDNPCEYFIDVM